jgi:TPP-dependent pyruvate/acetoin dehydrogenase alpha subunit
LERTTASGTQSDTGVAKRPEGSERVSWYREMQRIRLAEEAIVDLYPEQEIRCPTHICIGQEAVPVGISANLELDDYVFSAHRSHGHYLAKGGDMDAMFAELYGKETGCASGRGGSQHLIDLEVGFMGSAPILASTIPVAVGAAWSAVMRNENRVTVVYFGDGATEEGAFHEAMNFAGVKQLPIVFVCENNLYSVHSSLDVRQPGSRRIADLANAHGVASLSGDGNDINAVWDLGQQAIETARSGNGPTLIEFDTYRWKEHCGPLEDTDLGYRSVEELESWQARCPVTSMRAELVTEGEEVEGLDAEITAEIAESVRFAKSSAFPDPATLFDNVYPGMGDAG